VIGALLIYTLQEQLTNSGLQRWGQVVLGLVLVFAILFAPEGLYERMRTRPRRAALAGVALVIGFVVAWAAGWGSSATDWLGTGLVAATVVLLASRPARRGSAASARSELAPSPTGGAPAP
jgi:branched-chain amino acid transport system permease protein